MIQDQTTVILSKKPSKVVDDVKKFSTILTLNEIEKIIEVAEKRKAEGKPIVGKTKQTSEQVISDLKMHRFEEGGH